MDDRLNTCPACNKRFSSSKGLNSHISQSRACFQKVCLSVAEQPSSDGEQSPATSPLNSPRGGFAPDDDFAIDPNDTPSHRASVEDVPDEDDRVAAEHEDGQRFVEEYPGPAGTIIEECQTAFEKQAAQERAQGLSQWHPFASQDDWELASWLMTAGLSRKEIDDYLALPSVSPSVFSPV